MSRNPADSAMRFEQDFQAALAAANADRNQEALAACSRLLRVRPDDPAVLQLQAIISLRTGDPASALNTILRGLIRRPGHVPSLVLAGQAALALQAFHQAVEPLRQAVKLAPNRSEPSFLLCHALLGLLCCAMRCWVCVIRPFRRLWRSPPPTTRLTLHHGSNWV